MKYLMISVLFVCGLFSSVIFTSTALLAKQTDQVKDGYPQRIVALSPHSVELLYAIGAGDKIVAVITHSDYPEAAKKIEVIGDHRGITLEKLISLKPDLVITDISMPKINGLKASHLLSQELPEIKVVILTMHDNKEYIQNAIDSGAKGYILKDKPAAEMIAAVRAIFNGKTHFCPESLKP